MVTRFALAGLDAIGKHLRAASPERLDVLRGKLCIGIHQDVEVTDVTTKPGPVVSQAFVLLSQWRTAACRLLTLRIVCVVGVAGRIRSHTVGRGAERAAWRIEHRSPHISRPRCLWK